MLPGFKTFIRFRSTLSFYSEYMQDDLILSVRPNEQPAKKSFHGKCHSAHRNKNNQIQFRQAGNEKTANEANKCEFANEANKCKRVFSSIYQCQIFLAECSCICFTINVHALLQRFSTCGPRTPGGPRGASKGVHGQVKESSDFSCIKVLLGLVDWLAFS
ncbi:hypothetical protein BsWGS_13193 [Bradybaena similaris]